MRIDNPFDASALGLYSAAASVVSLDVSELFALHGYRVATALAMVAWVVSAWGALWLWKIALSMALKWLDDRVIDYQVAHGKLEPVNWGICY